MELGEHKAGRKLVDLTKQHQAELTLNEKGGIEFPCNAGSVSVWVTKELAQNFLSS